jgi:hypothetical protein
MIPMRVVRDDTGGGTGALGEIRPAKQITPVARSRALSKTVPKRKSVGSTEEASNRKKAAPRMKKKNCSECKQVKPCSEYFGRQLCKRNRKCASTVSSLIAGYGWLNLTNPEPGVQKKAQWNGTGGGS